LAVLVLLNNFLHDLSAACWLVATTLLWFLLRKKKTYPEAVLADVASILVPVVRFSLGGIVLFGLIRALAYKKYEWNAAAGESQVTLLIGKHIIFAVVLVAGAFAYARARKMLTHLSRCATKA
jgi:putative copper export protein